MAAANGFVTVTPDTLWGDGMGANAAQEHEAEKFTTPVGGAIDITEIGFWGYTNQEAGILCRMSIWTHDATNNCPETMVSDSETDGIAVPYGGSITKIYFTYSSKPQLAANTVYWLAMKGDTSSLAHSRFAGGGNSIYYQFGSAYPEWPNESNWEDHGDQGNQDSMYAVYTAGGTDELTATEIATDAPSLETPTIGTGADALTATEISTGAPSLAIPTIGQIHALDATEIATAAPTIATATIGQTHKLTATEIATGAPTIETSSCGTTGTDALDATDIVMGAPALATPAIGQVHGLLAADLYAGQPTLDTATLAQIHALVASGIITGPPELETPAVDAGIHQELVLVTGEFTQLETVTGAFAQLETVSGAFTQLVTVTGKLLEED